MRSTLRAERDGDPAACVFGDSRGRPFANYSTTRKAQEAWRAAGIARCHSTRRGTRASRSGLRQSPNPKRVQALAGHASVVMTLDRYGKHMNLGIDEAAAEVTRFLEKHGG
jgi:integrase